MASVLTSKPLRCLTLVTLAASTVPAIAASPGAVQTTEHVRAELLAHAPRGVVAGAPVWLALAIDHQPRWHSYWRNPGDSGLPTTLSWQLNDGAIAGEIVWPTPQAYRVGPLVNYGYEGRVLLAVPVTIPPDFKAGALRIALQAEWLVCKDVCVPESREFTLEVPARTATTANASEFDAARARVPGEPANVQARAAVERRALAVEADGLPSGLRGRKLLFFAELAGVVEHAAAVEQRWEAGRWIARVPLSAQRSESPQSMHAVLVPEGQASGVRVRLTITGAWSGASAPGLPAPRRVASLAAHNARHSPSTASTKE